MHPTTAGIIAGSATILLSMLGLDVQEAFLIGAGTFVAIGVWTVRRAQRRRDLLVN